MMRLSSVNSINFYGKIIDSHVHVGNWSENGTVRDYTKDIDVFIKSALDNGDTVENVIVSNLDCMTRKEGGFYSDETVGNKRLLELAAKNPKIAPLATCQPGYGDVENIRKLLREHPNQFVGFKFHPEQLNIPANDSRYQAYMDLAKEKNLPCLFHSARTFDVTYPDGNIGKASEFSNPMQIYELARKYKDVPVVFAHWGGDGEANINFTTRCIIDSIKRGDANLYADISWVDCDNPQKPNLKRIIEQLKAENALDRIMFGTDAPLGRFSSKQEYEKTINDIKSMIRREFSTEAEDIIAKIFYSNAKKVFLSDKGPDEPKPPQPKTPEPKGNKWTKALIAAGILILGVIGWHYYNKHNKSKSVDIKA